MVTPEVMQSNPAETATGGPHPSFGVGIETPNSSAVSNGILNVAADPGHTFAYIKNEKGQIIAILSFGPGQPIGASNKNQFKSGTLPGNAHWPIFGNISTWEIPITKEQMKMGIKLIADFKENPPNYTPSLQCTTATLSIASKIGVNLPSGIGPVVAKAYGISLFSENVPNPYQLAKDMAKTFGDPIVVSARSFPPP